MKYFQVICAVVISFLFLFIIPKPVVYAAGSISLSPSSQTVPIGSTLSVEIHMNSGTDNVNAVQVDLNYPEALFAFQGITADNSAFPIDIFSENSTGAITINRGIIGPGISGDDKIIATVLFKALTASTQPATISIGNNSALVRSSDQVNILYGKTDGSYTVTDSSATPTSPAQATQAESAGPIISNIMISDITYNTATISWKTNVPATSLVEYGMKNTYGSTMQVDDVSINHEVKLPENSLSPGTIYHFRVKSGDAANNTSTSQDGIFTTKGITVSLNVTDDLGTVLPGVKVSLASKGKTYTRVSNSQGTVAFDSLPPGTYNVTTEHNGTTQESTITVLTPSHLNLQHISIPVQKIDIKVAGLQKQKTKNLFLYVLISIMCGILLVGVILWKRQNRTKNNPPPLTPPPLPTPLPTVTPIQQ